jgi:bifunctional N-acetylglucosamine-1-phosphate-uridyltransferase/glucosamine-1-phosphate-acetyltransferase GlmU-like protein
MPTSQDFFDVTDLAHPEIFQAEGEVWTALDRLPDFLASFFREPWPLLGTTGLIQRPLAIHQGKCIEGVEAKPAGPENKYTVSFDGEVLEGAALILPGAYLLDGNVIIGSGTIVEPGAMIKGPTVIGKDCQVRQGAYIRGNCLVGHGCVVGHATEMKGSIMLDGAKAGHFAYVGDSILGKEVNLGAGTKLANLRMIPGTIVIRSGKDRYDTGRRKLGAILGDGTETGCNSVISPGTLTGPRSIIYPGIAVPGGYYPGRTIFSPPKGWPSIRSATR